MGARSTDEINDLWRLLIVRLRCINMTLTKATEKELFKPSSAGISGLLLFKGREELVREKDKREVRFIK